MRVCVLRSSYEGTPLDGLDFGGDPGPWLSDHHLDDVLIHKATAARQVEALAGEGYDVFLNLCDGTWHDDIAGVEVVEALERHRVPFTGPSSRLYALTKAEMKRAALELGVATPAHVFAFSEADVETAARTLTFPLIVKHFDSYASLGMTARSRVDDAGALRAEAREMMARAGGGALIEEFIAGDELTVLVMEDPAAPQRPSVLPPLACAFPPGETFKHFDLKWRTDAGLSWIPRVDPRTAAMVSEMTARIFTGLGGQSYSRCDFRVDASGRGWFLEINTTCAIFSRPPSESSADVILTHSTLGHRGFLDRIFECARKRAGLAGSQADAPG